METQMTLQFLLLQIINTAYFRRSTMIAILICYEGKCATINQNQDLINVSIAVNATILLIPENVRQSEEGILKNTKKRKIYVYIRISYLL